MRLWILLMACALATGCFEPRFRDDLRCGPAGECPPGSTCGADDVCHTVGVPDARAPDALVIPDATPVACTGDGDCQTPPNPCLLAGVCDLGAGVCDFAEVDCTGLDGECTIGMCEPSTGSCVAVGAHEDDSCGAGVVCGAFGTCAGFADGVCDSSGEQTRDCTRNACENGACVADPYVETAACTRVTEGVDCLTDTITGCGACGAFSDTCDEGGTQSCTCTDFKCQSDVCQPVATTCSQACARDTDTVTCSPTTQTGCGACNYSDVCDEAASQTCTCTAFTCVTGSCTAAATSCSNACTQTTDGDECGCSACGSTGNLRTRLCSGGSCSVTLACGTCN